MNLSRQESSELSVDNIPEFTSKAKAFENQIRMLKVGMSSEELNKMVIDVGLRKYNESIKCLLRFMT